MADFADQAQDLQDLLLMKSLQKQRKVKPTPFSGACLSCEEPIDKGRYCDRYCREDHEEMIRRRR
jgi:hypothetical protein